METKRGGHDGTVVNLPTARVVLEELALVRYAIRTGGDEVRVVGGLLTFTVSQEMFDADGQYLGVGRIEFEGRREFGGTVRVDVTPRLQLPTSASSEDTASFQRMAKDLLEVLPSICRCGLIDPSCDCCGNCSGRGTLPNSNGAAPCPTCDASGYVLAEGRW